MIFKDKTVVITGASAGVGAAAARLFAEAGAKFRLVARSKRNLEAVAEELGELILLMKGEDSARPHFAKAWELLSQDGWLVANEKPRLARLKRLGGL